MKVIAISGKAQHGKDTTAGIMKMQLESDGYRVLLVHYADLLKHICRSFFGWDGMKDDSGRRLLQHTGTDVIRKKKPDFWVDFIIEILRLFPEQWDYVLIPDCRFPNELNRLREEGFALLHIRVVRPGFQSPLTKAQQEHESETAMDNVQADYYITNSGALDSICAEVSKVLTDMNGFHQLSFDELGR